jgi:hypothetical protein
MSYTNYQEALRELGTFDVGRTAYFDVTIGKTPNKSLSYLCHTAELPGESVATVTQKIYGVVEKFPIMSAYNDVTLSFYTRGKDYDSVRDEFLNWIATATGRQELVDGNNMPTYNVQYKSDIVRDIKISHYDMTGKELTVCDLFDAFPISISQTPLSWSAANQAVSLNITFAYTEYSYTVRKGKKQNIKSEPSTQTTWNYDPYPSGTNFMSQINVTTT